MMETLQDIIKKRKPPHINVNNVIKYNNVTNVKYNNNKKSFALDKSNFKPNTPEADFAIGMAEALNDTQNFAFYRYAIQEVGYSEMRRLFSVFNDDIRRKKGTKYPIKNPVKYFVWLVKDYIKKKAK